MTTSSRLDAPAWRVAERLRRLGWAAGWQARGWWQAATLDRAMVHAGTSTTSRHPLVRAMVAVRAARAAAPDPDAPRWLLAELDVAARAGAYEHAAALGTRLAPALATLPAPSRRRATRLLDDIRRARGGPGGPTPGRAARDGLDPITIGDAVAAGALRARDVEARLAAHPRALLRDPELHLLPVGRLANEPEAAAAALRRYLRAYGLPGGTVDPAPGPLLARVRFAPVAPVDDGPLVSIVVAAHGAAGTLGYALASLTAQSYRRVEILVGDDASDDATLAAARAAAAHDPRVRVFASTANQGAYNLRNALVARARGELITFHDADDLALPGRIATQVARLRAGAVASYGSFLRVDAAGRFAVFPGQSALRLCMVTLMTSRRRFDALGGFRPARFGADLELRERLRDRHGEAAIDVVRAPVLFALWTAASQTRRAGAEAHADGYRAPARRAYGEVVFRALLGEASDADVVEVLRGSGNLATPADVTELG